MPERRAGRRRALAALAALPWLAPAAAQPGALSGLRRWGSATWRRFGLAVYDATLWAGDDPQRPPLALRLDYRLRIGGQALAGASLREMRRLGAGPVQLAQWHAQMLRIFPDVAPGDHLLGLYRDGGAAFYQQDRLLGEIGAPGFAAAFFGIWLDPRTSEPDLRAALLRRAED